jgi:hypothetical protein
LEDNEPSKVCSNSIATQQVVVAVLLILAFFDSWQGINHSIAGGGVGCVRDASKMVLPMFHWLEYFIRIIVLVR